MLPKRSKILVIQLARMGDLFHSRPACEAALRRFHPADITFACDARYAEIVRSFPEVEEVLPLPLQNLTALAKNSAMLPDLLAGLTDCVRDARFDVVVNITNHKTAILLASMFHAPLVFGYGATGTEMLDALESSFNRAESPTHVAAVWKALISNSSEFRIPFTLQTASTKIGSGSAAVICDAGSPERSLTSQTIAVAVDELSACGYADITLVGSESGDVALNLTSAVQDLRGRTTLRGLRDCLENADYVVGPDTGALHFAAAFGKRLCGIYLSGALPEVTGPLSRDAICVTADNQGASFLAELRTSLRAGHAQPREGLPAHKSNNTPDALSIIILEHGQTHYADKLIEMLRSFVLPHGCEIIVMSSELSAADTRFALDRSDVVSDVSTKRRSFADSCNRAALIARGDWLLVLNDDCEIASSEFNELWSARDSSHICAPSLRYWDGELQSRGFTFDGLSVDEITTATSSVEPHGVSAAAMLIHRDTFSRLGGFYPEFENGYEDVDFCLRAQSAGFEFKIADCSVVHYRGSSPERFKSEDTNLSLLRTRWSHKRFPAQKPHDGPTGNGGFLMISDVAANSAGAVLRWRDPAKRIGLREGMDFSWICSTDLDPKVLTKALSNTTTVLAFRSINDGRLRDLILKWQKSTGGSLILDCDDILLNRFPEGTPRALARNEYEAGVRQIVDHATLITAPSERTLSQFRFSSTPVAIVETCPMPAHFTDKEATEQFSTFNIGYAGSPVHQTDLALVAESLAKVLDENEDVKFYWWGTHPGPLAYHPQVRRGGPWINDYYKHLERIQRVPIHLWIAPLADSPHNAARSPIKAFEYICANRPCIFSNVSPFKTVLSKCAPNTLVENTSDAWSCAIQKWMYPSDNLLREVSVAATYLMERSNDLSMYRQLLLPNAVPNDCSFEKPVIAEALA